MELNEKLRGALLCRVANRTCVEEPDSLLDARPQGALLPFSWLFVCRVYADRLSIAVLTPIATRVPPPNLVRAGNTDGRISRERSRSASKA